MGICNRPFLFGDYRGYPYCRSRFLVKNLKNRREETVFCRFCGKEDAGILTGIAVAGKTLPMVKGKEAGAKRPEQILQQVLSFSK